MPIPITMQGFVISVNSRSFKDQRDPNRTIEYSEIVLSLPESRNSVIKFTLDESLKDLDTSLLSSKEVLLEGELTEGNSRYTVEIDGKSKDLYITKPKIKVKKITLKQNK